MYLVYDFNQQIYYKRTVYDLSISIPSADVTSYVSKTSRNIVHMEMI